MLAKTAPILFPVLWSTGWIVARFSADFADPLAFLALRYLLAGVALLIFALIARAQWPKSASDWRHAMISGVFLHAIYLGGVWWAIAHGVPASISALIAALQPIFTVLAAPMLVNERIGARRWLGVICGFSGICLVLAPGLSHLATGALAQALWPIIVNSLGMAGATFGSLYQKRYIHSGDLRTIAVLQYVGAIAVGLPAAMLWGDGRIDWSWAAVGVMSWSVFGLSIGAIALLLLLIRQGEVSRAAQLIFLIPPLAALQAHFLFGETLSPVQIVGMIVTATGVALAARTTPPRPTDEKG